MSKFITSIRVDVQSVLKMLPARANPLDVRFNPEASTVEIEWDDDDFSTGYTFPVEFPLANLKAKKFPKGITKRRFVLSKNDPAKQMHELPGGATSSVQELPPEGGVPSPGVATQGTERVDGAQGKRGKGSA